MKPQDILFLITYAVLLLFKKPRLFVVAGLSCLVIAMPLFATWTFFTAERLTWYAGAFFATFVLISTFKPQLVQ